jgi:hypothetical protein
MTFDIFKWFHDEITALRAAIARLEGHTAAPESVPVPKPAEVVKAFTPAPEVHVDPHPSFDWAPYAGQLDRTAFFSFATRMGRPPNDAEQAAAYAAGVVKTITPTPSGTEPDRMGITLAADGGWLVCNVPSKTYNLNVPGPGHIQIPIAETPYSGTSAPDQVRVTLAGQPSQTFTNVHSAELRADVQGATTLLVELLDSAGNPQAEREVGLSMQFQPTA